MNYCFLCGITGCLKRGLLLLKKHRTIDIHTESKKNSKFINHALVVLMNYMLQNCNLFCNEHLQVIESCSSVQKRKYLIDKRMVSMMLKTSGADLQCPSILTFLSLTSGNRHRAHSLGIRPIYQKPINSNKNRSNFKPLATKFKF